METAETTTATEKRKRYAREKSRDWRKNHPGYMRAARRKHYLANRTERLAQKKRYYAANPDLKKKKDLQYKLGIPLQESTTVREYQHGVCAICGLPSTRL